MILKVYQPQVREDAENTVFLKLVENGNCIELIACNSNGRWINHILSIGNSDGTIWRYSNIKDTLGFRLDSNRRVKDCVSNQH